MDYWKHLTEDILPNWLKITPDLKEGGAYTDFNPDGTQKGTDKNVWFQGRALWSYAMAYRLCTPKPEYLDMCAHIYPFLKKCILENGELPFLVHRDGSPAKIRPVYYYSEMFAAMGCAQYYRICKDPNVWQTADTLFNTVFELYIKNRYTTQELPETAPVPVKTFGLHMAMLATAQFLRNAAPDPTKYDLACTMAVEEMMHGGYFEEDSGLLYEHRTLSGEPLQLPLGTISVPGHIYEAAWFVMCEGAVKQDTNILAFGKKLLDSAMPQGFASITDVIPTVCDLSRPLEESLKGSYLAWPQQEAVIAFRLGYNLYGDKTYLTISRQIETAMRSYYTRFEGTIWIREILKEAGNWVTSVPAGNHINGPFHYERYLLAMGTLEQTGSILPYMA